MALFGKSQMLLVKPFTAWDLVCRGTLRVWNVHSQVKEGRMGEGGGGFCSQHWANIGSSEKAHLFLHFSLYPARVGWGGCQREKEREWMGK